MFRPHHWITAVLIVVVGFAISYRNANQRKPTTTPTSAQDSFASYFNSEVPAADGFDFAVGDANGKGSYQDITTGTTYNGWYIATQFNADYGLGIHTGEDWNGSGGGNTDLGQDVHAVANGVVTFAQNCGRLWGNVISVEHRYYENQTSMMQNVGWPRRSFQRVNGIKLVPHGLSVNLPCKTRG